ncbi:MAG: PKD domain-containing protein [Nitrospira sp.]|nr:PKD domain-containing protein [Nitrospira sp.]
MGQTEALASVFLLETNETTTASADGKFSFSNVSLALGANTFTVQATDIAGNQRTATRTITRLPADSDGDGTPDSEEGAGPNGGDANNDGIPDSQQANVVSVLNRDSQYITLVAPTGAAFTAVQTLGNPSPADAPAGITFPLGFVEFQLTGLTGDAATVDLLLPAGVAANTYWKYDATPDNPTPHWYEFLYDGTTGAEINGNVVTLHFQDGARGDSDLTVNGRIADPSGPAFFNVAPVARPGGPYVVDLGSDLTLNGTGSSDPNAPQDRIVSYQWLVNNSIALTGPTPALTAEQINAFGVASFIPIRLTVTDSFGLTHIGTSYLTVYDNQPVAVFTINPNPLACGQSTTFDASGSTHGRPDRSIVSYAWDFGDGTTGSSRTATHIYVRFGSYTVTLTVTDNNDPAKTDSVSHVVDVNQGNRSPSAVVGGPYIADLGSDLTLDGTGSMDPDLACGDQIVSYDWLVNNSIVLSGPTPTLTAAQIDGLPVASPITGQPQIPVQLTVTDSFGRTATVTSTLRVYDNRPIAAFAASPNPARQNETIFFSAAASSHGRPDRSIVSYEWDFGDGTTAVGLSVSHLYNVVNGDFTVTLTVTDNNSPAKTDTASLLVGVRGTNVAPVASAGGPYVVDLGSELTLDGTRSSDPNAPQDRIVSYQWLVNNSIALTGPTPTLTPAQIDALGAGQFIVRLTVTDSFGLTNIASTTLTVIQGNQAPTLDPIGNRDVNEEQLLSFIATATDPDLPADSLTFTLENGATGLVPSGASINPTTGLFAWTPTEAQGPGSYTFDVIVTDNGTPLLSDRETITITVNEVNVAPVLAMIGNQTIDERVLFTFTATATDADLPANSLTFSLENGVAGLVPTGASINPTTGLFAWTPTEAQGPASHTFDVVVTDNGRPNLSDRETIAITVQEPASILPLNPLPPLGSRMYVQDLTGQIDTPFAGKSFTIALDAGQTITMGVFPQSASLRPRIELLDSTGTVLAAAESPEIGVEITLQAVRVPTTGIYTFRVQSLSGIGAFRAYVLLNSLSETEFVGGPTHNTVATAIDLSLSSLPLQGSADRMAMEGVANGGNDFYRVDLAQNQVMFATLQAFGGGDIGLELRDSAGTVLTLGQDNLPNAINRGILGFVAPATGSYYLNVTGLPGPDPIIGIPLYSLVVTRESAFDLFPNDDLATGQDISLTDQSLGSVGARIFPQIGLTVPDPVDFYSFLVNAGDVLAITTTTPGDGAGEPANTLDPALQLFDPSGTLIASNNNGAADGHNAVISATAATTGQYKIAVLPTAGSGDYTVRVTGATGQPALDFSVSDSALASSGSQASVNLQFSSPVLLPSVSASDVTIDGVAASSVDVVDAQTLRFTVNGVAPVGGGYTVNLAAGVVQDFRRVANSAFSRLFTGDTIAPVVTASSITPLTVLQPNPPGTFTPITVTFTFNEPIDQSTLTADDVQLRFGITSERSESTPFSAASLSYNPTLNQLTAQFNNGLPQTDLITLTLVSGPTGIHDLAGNPLNGSPNFPFPSGLGDPIGDNYAVEFGVGPASPSFEPLMVDLPFGSLVSFTEDLLSTFATSGETDVWTVELQAGQTIGVELTPTKDIQGKLTVVDPSGATLGTVSSSDIGQKMGLLGIPVAMAGTYRIEVSSLSGVGAYRTSIGLDAVFDIGFLDRIAGTTGHETANNTVATAQDLSASVIPLQGTATRLAANGVLASRFDADVYSFQLSAGQPVSLVLHDRSATTVPVLDLVAADGGLLASGVAFPDGTLRISDFVPTGSGTYFARIASAAEPVEYNLVVTRGASFERPGTDVAPQDIALAGQVLGGLERQGHGANGAIHVAVLGGTGAVALVNQLNDDTYYDFDAMVVTDSDINTIQKLSNFDVVVIGDPTSRSMLAGPVEQALQTWWYSGGGGLVGTGGLVTAAGPAGGFTLFGLDNVIPVNLNTFSTQTINPTLTITPALHEVSQNLQTFGLSGTVELPAGEIDPNAVLLGTVNGMPAVVALDQRESGQGPRSGYLAPMYFDQAATGLRSGSADRLLEQAVAWASHVDIQDSYRVNANAGDQMVIRTTTPFDGAGLPGNLLDPRLELLNPQGAVVASNDNGAPDGKNALMSYTVPVGSAGTYTIRVKGLEVGEYTVSVIGAAGSATVSAETTPTATISSAIVVDTTMSYSDTTTTADSTMDLSLAYVQRSWLKDFVAGAQVVDEDEEDLLIALPG